MYNKIILDGLNGVALAGIVSQFLICSADNTTSFLEYCGLRFGNVCSLLLTFYYISSLVIF